MMPALWEKYLLKASPSSRAALCLSDAVGKMNDDSDRLIDGQFASPTDDEILRLAIEVALPKRKWIERVKELRDLIDAELNYIL